MDDMGNKVHLYMASLPDRMHTLWQSMHSLAQQVDTIQLAINYPAELLIETFSPGRREPVNTFYGKPLTIVQHDNRLKDGARFINADKKAGYCIVCDDDILYPPDFVSILIKYYEADPGFITTMGKILKPRPLKSYYRGWEKNYKTFAENTEYARVDIPGCCGILWHTDEVKVNQTDMHVPNSDVCIGVLAHQRGLPCYVIPHAADWLKDLMPELPAGTLDIYKTYRNNDALQTNYINRWM